MNARLKLLGVLLRKDLRLYWLFAVFTAALSLMANFDALWQQMEELANLVVYPAFALASSLLILLVFHEDSTVSATRDWLTRPVPRMTLLAAKCVFVALVILLPGTVGAYLNGMKEGYTPGEALVSGIAGHLSGGILVFFLCAMAFAAITANIRQAIVALLVGVVMLGPGSMLLSRISGYPTDVGTVPGSEWIRSRMLVCLVSFSALGVLWVMYGRRHGRRGALALAGMAALAGGTWQVTMNGSRMFALQQRLSPDPAAASFVAVSLLPGCFPAGRLKDLGATTSGEVAKLPVGIFPYQQRERAGTDAVAFAVRLIVDRLPEGGRLILGPTQLTYRTADGAAISLGAGRTSPQLVETESGQRAMDHYWLLPNSDYERLAADPSMTAHLEYSLSLLTTSATAVFAADGRRAYRAGIGYCGATVSRGNKLADVDCYRAGDQPALLAARLEGQPDTGDRASGDPDYTPAVLDFWGGRRHHMYVADVAAGSHVRVTAYAARVHFTRQFDVPGVLGGPVSSCSVP